MRHNRSIMMLGFALAALFLTYWVAQQRLPLRLSVPQLQARSRLEAMLRRLEPVGDATTFKCAISKAAGRPKALSAHDEQIVAALVTRRADVLPLTPAEVACMEAPYLLVPYLAPEWHMESIARVHRAARKAGFAALVDDSVALLQSESESSANSAVLAGATRQR